MGKSHGRVRDHLLSRVVEGHAWHLLPRGGDEDLLGACRPALLRAHTHTHTRYILSHTSKPSCYKGDKRAVFRVSMKRLQNGGGFCQDHQQESERAHAGCRQTRLSSCLFLSYMEHKDLQHAPLSQ